MHSVGTSPELTPGTHFYEKQHLYQEGQAHSALPSMSHGWHAAASTECAKDKISIAVQMRL